MPPLMHLGLANAVCAAVLAVLALLVGRYLRRPALTHCVWLLVLIKLVTPPFFSLKLPWLPAPPSPESAAPAEETNADTFVVHTIADFESVGPPTAADVWMEMEKGRLPKSV